MEKYGDLVYMFSNSKKINILCFGLLIVVAIFFFSQIVNARLSVDSLNIKLKASSGESVSSTLTISNTGDEVIEVNVGIADWWRTPEGNLQLMAPGSRERSCAEWILYSPSSLSIEPGEGEEVSLEIDVPEKAKGDHWAMLLVTEQPKSVEQEDQQVSTRVTVNYAIKVLQQDPNTNEKNAKITNLQVNSVNPLNLSIYYKNTGQTHLQTTGRVEIRDLQGETVKKLEIEKFPTLPSEKHIISVKGSEQSEELPSGTYYAIVIMDFGGDHLIQGGLPIQIPDSD